MNGRVLALLLVVVTIAVGEAQHHYGPQRCENENAAKISQLIGLRQWRTEKIEKVNTLNEGIQEALESINSTIKEAEEIDVVIESMITPELEEINFSQACDIKIPKDCCEINQMFPAAQSGLYAIRDPCSSGSDLYSTARLTVYCDMETDGGGWIVIQRRNASMGWVNFYRNWADYEKGFGDLDGEFWIGLKNIYELTNQKRVSLKLSVWNDTVNYVNWNYPFFRISDGHDRYALRLLHIGQGSGEGSDIRAFVHGGNHYFTTFDHYTGNYESNCGFRRQSGWWYHNGLCGMPSNPNGLHLPSGLRDTDRSEGERLMWRNSTAGNLVYTHSKMMIRPESCQLN